ncbi:MAG: host-nuclease inhibitor Gam family protein [Acidobacteria bacterium]|nr:host-nuclease inhibitor Gam family protein [Acidobacteriota bacterium]
MTRKHATIAEQSRPHTAGDPRCWEDVNQRLARLGEIECEVGMLRSRLNRKIAELTQQAVEASRAMEAEQGQLREQIERFYWTHRDEVLAGGRKSVELPFGRLGTRHSRSVVVADAATAQRWLAANGLERYLRTRTELDREAIRAALLDENGSGQAEAATLLGCPQLGLRESEQFWYEVNPAERILGHLPAEKSQAPKEKMKPLKNNPTSTRREPAWAGIS